jgi:hypothetical protein
LKSASSIEKMAAQITELAGAGNLTEQHKRDLMELLEGRQQVIVSIVEEEVKPKPPEEQKQGFDPNTELIGFGAHKEKTWAQAPKAWLVWLQNNTQKPELKEKVRIVLEGQDNT